MKYSKQTYCYTTELKDNRTGVMFVLVNVLIVLTS